MRAIPDRSKAYLYEVSMTSLQGAIKWSHEGFRYFLIKILIIILVEEIVLHTGKSHLNCPLSVNPLIISIGQEYRSLISSWNFMFSWVEYEKVL